MYTYEVWFIIRACMIKRSILRRGGVNPRPNHESPRYVFRQGVNPFPTIPMFSRSAMQARKEEIQGFSAARLIISRRRNLWLCFSQLRNRCSHLDLNIYLSVIELFRLTPRPVVLAFFLLLGSAGLRVRIKPRCLSYLAETG